MSTTDVIEWLVENGPATRQEIIENSDLSKTQIIRNLSNMKNWEAYYNISIDDSGRKYVYDAEKKDIENQKGFSMSI